MNDERLKDRIKLKDLIIALNRAMPCLHQELTDDQAGVFALLGKSIVDVAGKYRRVE
jgi:hypothetical protein